jgi:hypothetical protein
VFGGHRAKTDSRPRSPSSVSTSSESSPSRSQSSIWTEAWPDFPLSLSRRARAPGSTWRASTACASSVGGVAGDVARGAGGASGGATRSRRPKTGDGTSRVPGPLAGSSPRSRFRPTRGAPASARHSASRARYDRRGVEPGFGLGGAGAVEGEGCLRSTREGMRDASAAGPRGCGSRRGPGIADGKERPRLL